MFQTPIRYEDKELIFCDPYQIKPIPLKFKRPM